MTAVVSGSAHVAPVTFLQHVQDVKCRVSGSNNLYIDIRYTTYNTVQVSTYFAVHADNIVDSKYSSTHRCHFEDLV
jgi:hypothetical protein